MFQKALDEVIDVCEKLRSWVTKYEGLITHVLKNDISTRGSRREELSGHTWPAAHTGPSLRALRRAFLCF